MTMEKQCIIALGRESGSGGHMIADGLAKKLGIKLYDRNIIGELIQATGYERELVEKHEEKPVNTFLSSTVRGYSNSIEENIALKEFELIRTKAKEGESFVIVGRCAEDTLNDFPGLISIFVLGDQDAKAARKAELLHISKQEAEHMNKKIDKKRRSYHNYFCDTKWGDSRSYDITVNSSRLAIEKIINILFEYVKERNS